MRARSDLAQRDEQLGLDGEPDAAPGRLEEAHPGLLLQRGDLLRDRGRAAGEGLGDRRDGAAVGELAEQSEPSNVEHERSFKHQVRFTLFCSFRAGPVHLR